jgi:hypothetical protein
VLSNFFFIIIFFTKMVVLSFPVKPVEIRETCGKFFPRYKSDPKDSAVRILLPQFDFDAMADKHFPTWLELDNQLIELLEKTRIVRQQRDDVWETELRPGLAEARKIINFSNTKTPAVASLYGFPQKSKKVKQVATEKSMENDLKRAESKANSINEAKALATAMKEAKAIAKKSSAMASITVGV